MNTILETFAETEKANRKECEKMDAENAAKIRTEERKLSDARAQLEKERGIRARLMADYGRVESELQTAATAEIEAKAVTAEKVKRGEVSVDEYLKGGMNQAAIRKQAADETRAKLAGLAKILREKSARIYELETAEAEAVYILAYLTYASPHLRLEKLKQGLQGFERSLNPLAESLMAAGNSRNSAENNLLHAQGKHVFNILWDSISVLEIKDLLFDARIPENLLPQIEEFLSTADPGLNYRGTYLAMTDAAGTRPYISFTAIGAR